MLVYFRECVFFIIIGFDNVCCCFGLVLWEFFEIKKGVYVFKVWIELWRF